MADGDVVSVTIDSEGAFAHIRLEGMTSGGTYAFGLGTRNSLVGANPKIVLTAVSKGFDDAGNATTITRTIYGTAWVRKPYHASGPPDGSLSGDFAEDEDTATAPGDVIIRVALNEPIWQKDKAGGGNSGTDVTYDIQAGFYTDAGGANNAGAGTATNDSTWAYPTRPIAKWAWYGNQAATASNFILRVVAGHVAWQQNRAVAAIKFTVSDGATTVTKWITKPSVDRAFGDAKVIEEWLADYTGDIGSFIQGADLTCNFIAYPWIGETVTDTSTGVWPPTLSGGAATTDDYPGPQTWLCDRTGAFGGTSAVVDADDGVDVSGATVLNSAWNPSSPPAAYLTFGAALAAIKASNLANFGRSDGANSFIYVRAATASYTLTAGTAIGGTAPKVWLTVAKFPGDSRSGITIGNTSGTAVADLFGKLVKLDNVRISGSGGTTSHFRSATTYGQVWSHQCEWDTSAAAGLYSLTIGFFTQCLMTAFGATNGIRPFSTENTPIVLIRGCTFPAATFTRGMMAYCVIGNTRTGNAVNASGMLIGNIAGQTQPKLNAPFVGWNEFYGLNGDQTIMLFGESATNNLSVGLVLVNNIFECTSSGLTNPNASLAADNANQDQHNYLIAFNAFLGRKNSLCYNEVGTAAIYRRNWRVVGNFFSLMGKKDDLFDADAGGGAETPHAARIGAWPGLYGNWWENNYDLQQLGLTGQGLVCDFFGVASLYEPSAAAYTVPQFVAWASVTNSGASPVAGTGGGNYQYDPKSPNTRNVHQKMWMHDTKGKPRSRNSTPGPYAFIHPGVMNI